jgi:hypothetical protein
VSVGDDHHDHNEHHDAVVHHVDHHRPVGRRATTAP